MPLTQARRRRRRSSSGIRGASSSPCVTAWVECGRLICSWSPEGASRFARLGIRDSGFANHRPQFRYARRGGNVAARSSFDPYHYPMRALVKERAAPGFVLKQVPEPAIRDDEVLIQVRRAGVCGTDVHIYEWDAWAQRALQAAVHRGARVRRRRRAGRPARARREDGRPRDRRGAHRRWHAACSAARATRTSCQNTRIIGVDRDGCFAEFIAMPATNVWHLDDEHLVRSRRHPRSDGERVPHGAHGGDPRRDGAHHRLRADRDLRRRDLRGGGRVARSSRAT